MARTTVNSAADGWQAVRGSYATREEAIRAALIIDRTFDDLEEGSRFTNGRVADLPERQEPRPVFPRFEEGGQK